MSFLYFEKCHVATKVYSPFILALTLVPKEGQDWKENDTTGKWFYIGDRASGLGFNRKDMGISCFKAYKNYKGSNFNITFHMSVLECHLEYGITLRISSRQ